MDYVIDYFGKKATAAQKKYSDFVNALIDKEYDSPLKETVASTILGGIEFVNKIKDKYLSGKGIDRNLPALRELTKTSIEEIIREVEAALGKNEVLSKKASIYLCHRYSGRTLREIGRHFGIGESAVSQTSKRFSMLLDRDKKLNKKIKYI